jgi:hypothetical protein
VHADDPDLADDQRHGFELLDIQVTFRARCPDCVRVEATAT